MKGNQHAKFATDALHVTDVLVSQGEVLARDGAFLAIGAQATLALAFEQRTANLLAFNALIPQGSLDEATLSLRKEIRERLGL